MVVRTLMYHDIVSVDNYDASGFHGPASAMYKLTPSQFEEHLTVISKNISTAPQTISAESLAQKNPFFLTFDDGGVSANDYVLNRLSELGWIAHFFITTDRIDQDGFLSKEQIRQIHDLGHCIGSHSLSHPDLSKLARNEIYNQWKKSCDILSEIIQEQVTVASVPGGGFNMSVAEEAARANVQFLFTSTPTTSVNSTGDCTILGRYGIKDSTPITLLEGLMTTQLSWKKQKLIWDLKKVVQRVFGSQYNSLMKIYFKLKSR